MINEIICDVNKATGDKINTYQIKSLIGKGGFALCYHVVQLETGKNFCAKVVRRAALVAKTQHKLRSEISIHSQLRHSNIVKFYKFFEDNTFVYLLLELCNSVSLAELLKQRKRFTELEARCLAYHIVQGVKYIHSKNVIHRDLKLGNLLLDNFQVKIADFGLASQLQNAWERRKTICGTPNYIAPEIITKDKDAAGHSFEVDIWAIGIVLYTLTVGHPRLKRRMSNPHTRGSNH